MNCIGFLKIQDNNNRKFKYNYNPDRTNLVSYREFFIYLQEATMKDVKIKVTFSIEKAKLHVEVAKREIDSTEQELLAKQSNPVLIEKKNENEN